MRCDTLDRQLSASFDDPGAFEGDVEAHVAECLRCQAQLVRYRRLRAELAGLKRGSAATDDDLLDDILGTLDASAWARFVARRSRQALCALVAAAGAAGAAGAIVAVGRARGRRLAG